MSGLASKIWEWIFGNPQPKKYTFDNLEDAPCDIVVMEHPDPQFRQCPLDLNSEDDWSDSSLVSFTREERDRAVAAGMIRPNSRLKLKYKRRKR